MIGVTSFSQVTGAEIPDVISSPIPELTQEYIDSLKHIEISDKKLEPNYNWKDYSYFRNESDTHNISGVSEFIIQNLDAHVDIVDVDFIEKYTGEINGSGVVGAVTNEGGVIETSELTMQI